MQLSNTTIAIINTKIECPRAKCIAFLHYLWWNKSVRYWLCPQWTSPNSMEYVLYYMPIFKQFFCTSHYSKSNTSGIDRNMQQQFHGNANAGLHCIPWLLALQCVWFTFRIDIDKSFRAFTKCDIFGNTYPTLFRTNS